MLRQTGEKNKQPYKRFVDISFVIDQTRMTRVLTDKLSYLEKSEASTEILEMPSRKNFAEMFWCKNVRYQTDSKSDGFTWRMKN